MKSLVGRSVIYVLWAFVASQIIIWEATNYPPLDQFSERGFVELAQSLVLLLAVLAAAGRAATHPSRRSLLLCLMLAFAILLVREQDQVLERWLADGVWKWPALVLMACLLTVFLRNRQLILKQIGELRNDPAIVVMALGFSVLVFSRFFGMGDFWQLLMGDGYLRVVKNAAEEGTELFALGFMTLGVIELCFFSKGSTHEQ